MRDVDDKSTARPAGSVARPAGEAADVEAIPMRVTSPRERARAFLVLFLSLTCLGMGQTVIFAILPPLSRTLGLIDFQVGAIFMVSAVMWLLMSPFWGRRSDVMGRKPVILIGLGGFVLSTALFAALLDAALAALLPMVLIYPLLILSRTVYGTLGPGANSAAQAYVADRTTVDERVGALASIGAAFILGTTFGPGMVWILSGYGLIVPLYGVAVLGAVSMIAIILFLPERTGPTRRPDRPKMKFTDARVREPLGIAVLLSSAQAIPVQTITFLFIDRFAKTPELAAERAALALLASSLATLFVQLVAIPRLRLSPRSLMTVGSVIASVGFVALVAAENYVVAIFGMMVIGAGFALARSGSVGAASLAVTPEEQGAVAGLVGATGGAGFIVAPLFAFPLYALLPSGPFILSLLFVLGIVAWLMLRPVGTVSSGRPAE